MAECGVMQGVKISLKSDLNVNDVYLARATDLRYQKQGDLSPVEDLSLFILLCLDQLKYNLPDFHATC